MKLASIAAVAGNIGVVAAYRVLVVEDDCFVATELANGLTTEGATVLGPVSTLAEGRQIANDLLPDCALKPADMQALVRCILSNARRNLDS